MRYQGGGGDIDFYLSQNFISDCPTLKNKNQKLPQLKQINLVSPQVTHAEKELKINWRTHDIIYYASLSHDLGHKT